MGDRIFEGEVMVGRKYQGVKRVRYSAWAVLDIREALDKGASWHSLLLKALSDQELRVLDFIRACETTGAKSVTTFDVANYEQCTINHASNILNQLTVYGLLDKQPVTDENGRHFVYRTVRDGS
jgi:hypothetical protein